MALSKIIQVSPTLHSKRLYSLEPSVQYITPGTTEGLSEKIASEAAEWATCVRPEEGKSFILVLAMGASEYYGPNRNGDGFREAELKKTYKTFEEHAHVFKSHVNKDPSKSLGRVVKAFYNDKMHRVELILCIDHDKAPKIAQKIRDRETVAVSMGCRIKFDVCSICGNKAENRAQYCEHAKLQMSEIYPDGRIVYVDNPNPKFFDISIVFRPADKTGYMLKKVAFDMGAEEKGPLSADLGIKAAELEAITACLNKAAEINKIVTGQGVSMPRKPRTTSSLQSEWLKHIVPRILQDYREIDNEDLGWLSGKKFPQVLESLSSMGILLSTEEFLDLFFLKTTGKRAPEGAARKLVELQGDVFRLLAKHPSLAKDVIDSGLVKRSSTDSSIVARMKKYAGSRSMSESALLLKTSAVDTSSGRMATLTYTDPSTNKRYAISRESAEQAQRAENVGSTAKLLGAGALGYGVYKGMGMALPGVLKPVALLPGILAGGAVATTANQERVRTDQGDYVTANAPFMTRVAEAKLAASLAVDYARSGVHTRANTGVSTLLEKTSSTRADGVLGSALDLNSVALKLGGVILGF